MVPSIPFLSARCELILENIFRQCLTGFPQADELPVRHCANAFSKFSQAETRSPNHRAFSKSWPGQPNL